jgi:hypothetical protein
VKDSPFSIATAIRLQSHLLTQPQWQKLLSRMARVTSIDIQFQGSRRADNRDLVELLGREAPSLEELVIPCYQREEQFVVFQSLMKGPCFKGNAASLRILKLHDCIIATSFPSLTDLTITGSLFQTIDTAYLLPWWDMCRSGGLSSLETLTIERAAFDESAWPFRRCSAAQGPMP